MTRAGEFLFVGILLGGCAERSPEAVDGARFHAELEGFTCDAPDGWRAVRDRGAVVFTSLADVRRTIVIRSVAVSPDRAVATIVADTQVVLSGMPAVQLERSDEWGGGAMRATEYRLTFSPPTSSERFRRRHVVVEGKRHVFHVIETAPATRETDDTVVELVSSMREAA